LWHWVLISFFYIINADIAGYRLELFAISVVLAFATYQIIEKPIRFGKFTSINKKVIGLVAIMIVVLIASWWIVDKKGYSNRKLPKSFAGSNFAVSYYAAEYKRDHQDEIIAGNQLFNTPENCEFNSFKNNNANTTLFIFGDSHAMQLYPGLARISEQNGFNVANYARSVHSMLLGITGDFKGDKCRDIENLRDFQQVIQKTQGKKIVLLNIRETWWQNTSKNMQQTWQSKNNLTAQETQELAIVALNQFAQNLQNNNIPLLLIGDIPEIQTYNPYSLLSRPFQIQANQYSSKTYNIAKAHNADWIKIIINYGNFIELLPAFCDVNQPNKASCKILDDKNNLLYKDDNHLNYNAGSDYVAVYLIDKIKPYLNGEK
jgi:hypothetical protein